jgi:hypothetical protein
VLLNREEKQAVLSSANDIGEGISADEYIELIEQMLFDAFDMGLNEPKTKHT